MTKYIVQIIVISVTKSKKKKGPIFVRGNYKNEEKVTSPQEFGNNEAKWITENCIVKTRIRCSKKDDVINYHLVTVTICRDKRELGSFSFDLTQYIDKMSNTSKGDFSMNYLFDKKGLTITMQVEINKIEKPRVEPELQKTKKEKDKTTTPDKGKERVKKERKALSSNETIEIQNSKTTDDLPNRIKKNRRYSSTKRRRDSMTTQSLKSRSVNNTPPKKANSYSLSPPRVTPQPDLPTIDVIPENQATQPATRQDTKSHAQTFPGKLAHDETAVQKRLVQREIKNQSFNRPGKVYSVNNNSHSLGVTKGEVRAHKSSTSDCTETGSSITATNVNVTELKQYYKQKQDLEAEKYLKELIMEETVRETHVVGYILWKSLLQWDSFKENSVTYYKSILSVCSKSMEHYMNSKTKQLDWLGICLTVLYLADEEKYSLSSEEMIASEDFIKELQKLTARTFDRVILLMKERSDLKNFLVDYLFSERSIKPDNSSFEPFWAQLSDTVLTIMTHIYFDGVKVQFLSALLSYFVNSVFDMIIQRTCSYSLGIQVKLLIEFNERWITSLMKKCNFECSTIIERELEPMRQAANVLFLRQKADLLKPDIRETVCGLLRPIHISQILSQYRPDNFDLVPVTEALIEKIAKQESTYTILPNTFDPSLSRTLLFNYSMNRLTFDKLEIPKVILDKPAFSFLKRKLLSQSNDDAIISPW